jgi:glycosyltransferase involved in cell wall biosynthesis
MKILQICSKPPYPKKDGYALAVNHISESLLNIGYKMKVVAISTQKHKSANLPKNYVERTDYEDIYIDTKVKIIPAFLNLFSNNSYNTNRFYTDKFAERLKTILHETSFDFIVLEGLYVCPYVDVIAKYSDAKIIFRAHNVESDIWKGLAMQTNNIIKRWYINHLQKKLMDYERTVIKKMDSIIFISEIDANWFKETPIRKSTTIPFAINTINEDYSPKEKSIFHIGSMDWKANTEGVKWFLDKVFPLVIEQKEDVDLHLAGRNMPKFFYNLANKNIVIDGEVEDAETYMKKNNLMIVPLWTGSGIRIKILEAMALGKTIISTYTGASGINYVNNKNILIANTAEEFAYQIIWCLDNAEQCKTIGKNANLNIQENYDSKIIERKLSDYLNKLQQL